METIGQNGRTLILWDVFSLPIRDGNSDGIYILPSTSFVFSLPIRDGNMFLLFDLPIQRSVFSLPIRDGNSGWPKGLR